LERNYPILCISPSSEPQGGIYRHQGKGGQGDNPLAQRLGAAARAAPAVARCHVCPLSAASPGFWFWAPGFDESALQSQWLYYRPLIIH